MIIVKYLKKIKRNKIDGNPMKGYCYLKLEVYEEDPNKTSLSSDCYPDPSIIKKAIPQSGKTAKAIKGTDFNIKRVSDNSLIATSEYEVVGYLDSGGVLLAVALIGKRQIISV